MSSIHEGSIGDAVKTISELIDLIKYGTGEAKKNRRYSAARLASDLVAVYPIILSKSVSKDSAVRIKKYIEAKEVQNLLLAIQATAISKATTGQEYLKNIHQNIDFASNGIEVPFEVIANMEGSYSSDLEVSYNELKSIMETMHRQENVKIYDTKLNPVSLNDFAITESAGSYNVRLEKITALTESEFDDLTAEIDDLESHGLHADANQLIASAHRYGKISAAEYKDAKMYASKKKAEYEISKKNSEKDRAEARRKEAEAMEILKKREVERYAEAKIDQSFLDCKVMPRVLDMPGHNFSIPIYELLREFYMGEERTVMEETMKAFELLEQADNLGSIMKFDLSKKTRNEMALRYKEWKEVDRFSPVHEALHSIELVLALTDKYTAVVENPPYMGSNNMNNGLKQYVERNYPTGKNDLMTVFMLVAASSTVDRGRWAMIDLPSWMFLLSFERFREDLFRDYSIESLLHLGRGVFGSDFGSVSFIIHNVAPSRKGVYRRLFKEHVQVRSVDEIERLYLNPSYGYYVAEQSQFSVIPGSPVGYWVSEKIRHIFTECQPLEDYCKPSQGMATADNNRFLRFWHEPSINRVGIRMKSPQEAQASGRRWFPYNKGGQFRRWYGNQDFVVNWENDGEELRAFKGSVIRNPKTYFKPSLSWSKISAGIIAFRYFPEGFLYDVAGTSMFFSSVDIHYYCAALLNSHLILDILKIISPTVNYEVGQIASLPIRIQNEDVIIPISKNNICISKEDWDAHETSWDFKENELVRVYKENQGEGVFMDSNRLEEIVSTYKSFWTERFNQLHSHEEELNRQFIEIYGLQDELTPDVPLDDITILQQGEISVEGGQLIWHNDVITKQLISYAIGCMMGRYRLDRPGLYIAYPNPSAADIEGYDFHGDKFEIDDDGIIPLLPRDCPFDDNARNRLVKFIRQVFGESFLNENLNFLEASLGRTLEDYLVKDFWKDHKKMYSNRPIYWLFSSKKGAFQCLTYMHRMNPYTAEAVRSKYLLPYIDFLKAKIAADMERASSLSTVERRNLDKMQVALDECLEYEERLHDVADHQIRFDLDDGVLVNYTKFGDVLAKIK